MLHKMYEVTDSIGCQYFNSKKKALEWVETITSLKAVTCYQDDKYYYLLTKKYEGNRNLLGFDEIYIENGMNLTDGIYNACLKKEVNITMGATSYSIQIDLSDHYYKDETIAENYPVTITYGLLLRLVKNKYILYGKSKIPNDALILDPFCQSSLASSFFESSLLMSTSHLSSSFFGQSRVFLDYDDSYDLENVKQEEMKKRLME